MWPLSKLTDDEPPGQPLPDVSAVVVVADQTFMGWRGQVEGLCSVGSSNLPCFYEIGKRQVDYALFVGSSNSP